MLWFNLRFLTLTATIDHQVRVFDMDLLRAAAKRFVGTKDFS